MKGFYYIENSVDEYHSEPQAFFETLDEAKEAMKGFSDWYRGKGTGKIYFQPFGTNSRSSEYSSWLVGKSPRFICQGKGLDDEGNVVFSRSAF